MATSATRWTAPTVRFVSAVSGHPQRSAATGQSIGMRQSPIIIASIRPRSANDRTHPPPTRRFWCVFRRLALDEKEVLEQRAAPRPLVIGSRRHRHVMIDPVVLSLVRVIAVIAERGDDQRQPFRALATIKRTVQTAGPARPVFQLLDQVLEDGWIGRLLEIFGHFLPPRTRHGRDMTKIDARSHDIGA